jgi:EAL domain-containing protein (putative c-di-GMP-specific phosphodiesterase class I)
MQSDWHQPTMAVNIAAQQLAKPDFVDEVVDVLRRTGMPAERLVLEITESVLLDDMVGTIASLARLRDRGIRVAIDDFGTGYSSLSYLDQLPVDVLKVDKSFVDKVCAGTSDTSLVEAIITMSHSLRLTTVAEGVERTEQAVWLQKARCSAGQGFLWSRPVELDAAKALLTHGPQRAALTALAAPPPTLAAGEISSAAG